MMCNASMSKDVVKALCLLKNIKQSTRETFLDAEVYRRRVAEQKDLVEAHHLKLQNLLYEKDHLLREIKRCRGFPTREMDKIEFKDGTLPVTVEAERHAQHLKRLEDELVSRQDNLQHQKDLKAQIAEVDSATLAKRALLESVPAEIAAIEKATLPLQSLLSIPATATHERHQEAKKLSAPLYVLFCELDAYMEIHGGMSLSIGEAKSIVSKARVKKSQGDDQPSAKRQKISRSPSPVQDLSAYTPAPYSLIVELALNGKNHSTKVIFQYLPALKVVVVDTPRYALMLRHLFAEDHGVAHPNASSSYIFEAADGNEMELDFPSDSRARPYLWAQWICGFHHGKRGELAVRPEPSIRQVMQRLHERYEAHHLLHEHFDILRDKRIEVHASANSLLNTATKTKLELWNKLPKDEHAFSTTTDGCIYYKAVFHHGSGRTICSIEIASSYPKDPPRFICQNDKDTSLPTAAQLKDLEVEVHDFAAEFVTEESLGWLLMHQMRRLQVCLDEVHALGTSKANEYTFGKKRAASTAANATTEEA
ncbi:hypothetical protein AeRB84_010951 [Aphanomyces euteiches]|nr:hypothetical protein AeRB84_010951 [Aphanomyces euteiches]